MNDNYFDELYKTTYDNLRQFVKRRSMNNDIVDDILQEVYIEVYRHIDHLKTHGNNIGWIYKTADNKIKKFNYIYSRNMSCSVSLEECEDWAVMFKEDNFSELDEYREILREDEYLLLIKKYDEGYSHKELADMTGSSVAGCKMKLSRIVRKLKNIIIKKQ